MAGIKDVENRSWRTTTYRGPLVIHAGQLVDREGVEMYGYLLEEMPTGVILGRVTLVDCVRGYPSEWATPKSWHWWQWILKDPKPLSRPIPMKGTQGLWDYHR